MSLSHPIRAWRAARAARAEVDSVPAAELEGWGLSRAEFRDIALMPADRQARMRDMAAIHGVSAERLESEPEVHRQVALACARCRDVRLCRDRMEDGAEAREMGFCPNHAAYEALAGGQTAGVAPR